MGEKSPAERLKKEDINITFLERNIPFNKTFKKKKQKNTKIEWVHFTLLIKQNFIKF